MKKYFPYILIFYCSGSVSLVLFYLLKAYEKKKKQREAEKCANILVLAMIQSGKISRRELDFARAKKIDLTRYNNRETFRPMKSMILCYMRQYHAAFPNVPIVISRLSNLF